MWDVWLQDVVDASVNSLNAQAEKIQATKRPGNALMDRYLDGPPPAWVRDYIGKDPADHHEAAEVWVRTELDLEIQRKRRSN